MAHPDAVKAWMDPKKRELRQAFGGQGLQNILAASALQRKNRTVYAAAVNSPELKRLELQDGADLIGLAMLHPPLTKVLASPTTRLDLPGPAHARIIEALQAVHA